MAAIRLTFLAFSIASTGLLVGVGIAGSAQRPEALIAAILAPALAVKWVNEHRGVRPAIAWDAVECAALLALGAAVGNPESILILLYARVCDRALDTRTRHLALLSGGYVAAFAGTIVLSSPSWGLTPQSAPYAFLASGFLLGPPVMRMLAETLNRLARTTERERALRDAVATLGEAITVATVHDAGVRALQALAGDPTVRVRIAEIGSAGFTSVQQHALRGGVLRLTGDDIARVWPVTDASPPESVTVIAPVRRGGSPRGVLIGGPALDEDTLALAIALAGHILLRLEAVTLRAAIEQQRIDEAQRESQENFRQVFDGNPQPLWLRDAIDGRFLAVNRAAVEQYGYTTDEFLAMGVNEIVIGGETEHVQQHRAKDGRVLEVEVDRTHVSFRRRDAVLTLARDVSSQREMQARLEHNAMHDPLTGLANQVLLRERLTQSLRLAQEANTTPPAVLVLDLDGFKTVNDTLGHALGDRVLAIVAARIARSLKSRDTAARLGGDEFAALLVEMSDEDDAHNVAQRIIAEISRPIHIQGRAVTLSASCGIALPEEQKTSPGELIGDADVAMYSAKAAGPGTCVRFVPALRNALMERISLEQDLSAALRRNELSVVYQPQVDLRTDRVIALEALVRWTNPTRGPVPPDVFIPIAERLGIVAAIDTWVLREALRTLREWMDQGIPDVRLAVNLSGQDLGRDDLVDVVRSALLGSMLDPWRLELELTETVAVTQPVDAIARLRELRAMGVRIAIDDFGTGFSMFSRIRELPIDRLKIDRSFVTDLERDDDARTIVGSTVAMSHALGLDLCAEGVETEATAQILRTLNCDHMQGYLISRPLPPAEMSAWLRRRAETRAMAASAAAR